jgi:hypothetical protein
MKKIKLRKISTETIRLKLGVWVKLLKEEMLEDEK